MKKEKRSPYNMYLGNLLSFKDGIGSVSDVKYVIVKEKSGIFAKSKYIAYPGNQEVLVGSYEISADNQSKSSNDLFLINAVRLSDIVGYRKIDSKKVCDILMQNNDVKILRKYL